MIGIVVSVAVGTVVTRFLKVFPREHKVQSGTSNRDYLVGLIELNRTTSGLPLRGVPGGRIVAKYAVSAATIYPRVVYSTVDQESRLKTATMILAGG